MTARSEPEATRPDMPYGTGGKLLPWRWAEERIEVSANYWIATMTADGKPHCRPVWGAWVNDAFYFSTGSRIGTHLRRDPRISVNLESGDEAIIFEGTAEVVTDAAELALVLAAYNPKYNWDMTDDGSFWRVRPHVVFGWICDGSGLDGGALYSGTATRWIFGPR
jgi:hypothetical protein